MFLFQLLNMSPYLLRLPWPLWAHRTAGTSIPSAVYGKYV